MQSSRWKFVVLWQLSGMVFALGVGALLVFIGNARQGVGVQMSALLVPGDLAFVIVGVVLIAPLSILTLWIWTRACDKYPHLERSLVRTLVNLTGCALGLAIAAGVISNWEVLRFESHRATFLQDTIAVTRSVLLWAIVGVVLPRLLVPALRPRPFAP